MASDQQRNQDEQGHAEVGHTHRAAGDGEDDRYGAKKEDRPDEGRPRKHPFEVARLLNEEEMLIKKGHGSFPFPRPSSALLHVPALMVRRRDAFESQPGRGLVSLRLPPVPGGGCGDGRYTVRPAARHILLRRDAWPTVAFGPLDVGACGGAAAPTEIIPPLPDPTQTRPCS